MALSRWERDARNQQIADAQAAIIAGDSATAQSIVDSLIGGANIGGAQAALQSAINAMPAPASVNPSGTTPSGGGGSNSGSGGSSFTSYPSPPPSTPPSTYWITNKTFSSPTGIKQADPDIILDPEIDTAGDFIVERFFEELGGTELISLSRHDLIDGVSVVYNPIANLSELRRRYNPNNIIAIDFLSEDEFSRTSIDLISRGIYEPYFDDNGDLVIEVDIIKSEENIEVEISQSGTVNRIEL